MLECFFNLFDKDSNRLVCWDEFQLFYTDMSSQVSSDQVFQHILSTTWAIPAHDVVEIHESYVKGIVERVREKLYNRTVGVKEEFVLKKIYQDFDIQRTHDRPGHFDIEQMDEL